jgi:hypothetical protein
MKTTVETGADSPYGPSYLLSSKRIGDYKVQPGHVSLDAKKVFGDPTTQVQRGRNGDCTMTWRSYGVRIRFYNNFEPNACRAGNFCQAQIAGENWKTTLGLQVGESVRRLRRLYPEAQEFPGKTTLWALERTGLECGGTGIDSRQGALNAIARDGKVVGFTVSYLGGGD